MAIPLTNPDLQGAGVPSDQHEAGAPPDPEGEDSTEFWLDDVNIEPTVEYQALSAECKEIRARYNRAPSDPAGAGAPSDPVGAGSPSNSAGAGAQSDSAGAGAPSDPAGPGAPSDTEAEGLMYVGGYICYKKGISHKLNWRGGGGQIMFFCIVIDMQSF